MRRASLAAFGLLLAAALVAPAPVGALTLDFGTPRARSQFGVAVTFEQPLTWRGAIRRVEILLTLTGNDGVTVFEIPPPAGGDVTVAYDLALADGHLYPNTRIGARWRVTGDDGSVQLGPAIEITYEDTRFDWRTKEGELVRIHWYEGSDAFAERALRIGDEAVRDAAALFGVTETEPIDFFVYADRDQFYDAIGPGSRENVGGVAPVGHRTLYALIRSTSISSAWVATVIPHELTHLVLDSAVDNPYGSVPRWLNEGVAVYLTEGLTPDHRAEIRAAVDDGRLIGLDGLPVQLPTTLEQFSLAYAESTSAVEYMVRTHGRDAMVALVRSYARGLTDDEAFTEALGVDTDAFQAAWLADIGAAPPTRHGPRPAPPGPVPPGWSAFGPGTSPAPGATPAAPATAAPADPRGGPAGDEGTLVVVLVGAVGLLGGLLLVLRRSAARSAGPSAGPPASAEPPGSAEPPASTGPPPGPPG